MNARSLLLPTLFALSAPVLSPGLAHAGPSASGSISTETGAEGRAEGKRKKRKKKKKDAETDAETDADEPTDKWIKRWPPTRNMLELGVYGGVFLPSTEIELFEPAMGRPDMGFREFNRVALDVGARVGFYPARFLGLEVEGGIMPTQTTAQTRAIMYHARGHLLAQLARWSVAPFILAGPSGLGVASDGSSVGNDIDLGFHFGGGVKFYFNRWTMLRLDLRDTLTARRGLGEGVANSFEALLGFSITLGRPKPEVVEPKDSDGDGFLDPDDKCVYEPGVAPDGCPIPDTDGDGFLDPDDACPTEKGLPPDGCPLRDTDGDGFMDDVDDCPEVPGVEPAGCPIGDTDGDGIMDDVDVCINDPETVNGFEDTDGCPDEVPKEIEEFTGVIEGIYFDTAKATIKAKSQPKLDAAVELLAKYPTLRLEISGHTDSKGKRDYNMDLSQRRADAVKTYLTDAGTATPTAPRRAAPTTGASSSRGWIESSCARRTAQGRRAPRHNSAGSRVRSSTSAATTIVAPRPPSNCNGGNEASSCTDSPAASAAVVTTSARPLCSAAAATASTRDSPLRSSSRVRASR